MPTPVKGVEAGGEHFVDVGVVFDIPGRNTLYGAECRTCDWRSREYRDFSKANAAADKHAQLQTDTKDKERGHCAE